MCDDLRLSCWFFRCFCVWIQHTHTCTHLLVRTEEKKNQWREECDMHKQRLFNVEPIVKSKHAEATMHVLFTIYGREFILFHFFFYFFIFLLYMYALSFSGECSRRMNHFPALRYFALKMSVPMRTNSKTVIYFVRFVWFVVVVFCFFFVFPTTTLK